MITCPRCGSSMPADRQFCTQCGSALRPHQDPPATAAWAQPENTAGTPARGTPPGTRPPRRRTLVVAGAALAAVVLIAGSYLVGNRVAADDVAGAAPATSTRTVPTTVLTTPPAQTLIRTVTSTEMATRVTTEVRTTTVPAKDPRRSTTSTNAASTDRKYLTAFTIAHHDRKGFDGGHGEKGVTDRIGGTRYRHALRTVPQYGPKADQGRYWQEYKISKRWARFTAVVGVSAGSHSNKPVEFRVIGDGTVLAKGTVRRGHPQHLNISVKGVTMLRLWVRVRSYIAQQDKKWVQDPMPVWGDPLLHRDGREVG